MNWNGDVRQRSSASAQRNWKTWAGASTVGGWWTNLLQPWPGPPVHMAELLIAVSRVHVALRLMGRASSYDQILNIVGRAALIVGAVLIPWDWAWTIAGGVDQYFLGNSHLVISLWATLITVLGLRRILGVPVWLGTLLSLLAIPVSLPLAILFMRSRV